MKRYRRILLFAAITELLVIGWCILQAGMRDTRENSFQAVIIPKKQETPSAEANMQEELQEGLREEEEPGAEPDGSPPDDGDGEPDTVPETERISAETEKEAAAAESEEMPQIQSREEEQTREEPNPRAEPAVRVRLTVSDYSSEYHDHVTISGSGTFQLQSGDKAQIFTGGQTITVSRDHPFFQEGSIRVVSEDGSIQIDSIAHRNQVNTYPGVLDLYLEENGIIIVNELNIEAYVERVVPSEMPASYGAQAAMLQAVCTRTYVYQKLLAGQADVYGAVVDDSTDYQVYNASLPKEVSSQATRDTRGIVMTWQGEPFVPYFFSTSCGYNSDNTIWGGEKLPFLRTQNLTYRSDINYLSEDSFRDFIMDWDYPAYEDDCTWYRWNYTIGLEELKETLLQRLPGILQENPSAVRAVGPDGGECPVDPAMLNGLKEIQVTTRLAGGMAGETALVCEQGIIYVGKEMLLRRLFASPSGIYTNRSSQGASESEGDYLPSAFFYPCANRDGETIVSYTFCGGGNGHGIGLSQNAANAMLQMGLTWQEVLQFFYLGTGMTQVY